MYVLYYRSSNEAFHERKPSAFGIYTLYEDAMVEAKKLLNNGFRTLILVDWIDAHAALLCGAAEEMGGT